MYPVLLASTLYCFSYTEGGNAFSHLPSPILCEEFCNHCYFTKTGMLVYVDMDEEKLVRAGIIIPDVD